MAFGSQLDQLQQIAFAQEAVFGTEETLDAADVGLRCFGIGKEEEMDMEDDEEQSLTLSDTGANSGALSRGINFGSYLAGPADGLITSDPNWYLLMRAGGWRVKALKQITIGAVTGGPYLHGESISQAVTGATAKVFKDTANGTTTLLVYDVTGSTDNSNVWTGADSAATATPSTTDSNYGRVLMPHTDPLIELSIGAVAGGPYTAGEKVTGGTSAAIGYAYQATADGDAKIFLMHVDGTFQNAETLTGADSSASATSSTDPSQSEIPSLTIYRNRHGHRHTAIGCRVSPNIELRSGREGRLNFSAMGANGGDSDVAAFSGTSEERVAGPRFKGISFALDSTTGLRIGAMSFSLENALAAIEDSQAASGILGYEIGARNWRGTMNLDSVHKGTFDFQGSAENETTIELDCTWGSVAGNQFGVYAKGMQIEGITEGNRENIATGEHACRFTKTHSREDDLELCFYLF
jgi:hypothetical protein|tara:strand:+ start:8880 stop:10277 length:1398 start_codon:yes stop_codon:yes gene_type:complete